MSKKIALVEAGMVKIPRDDDYRILRGVTEPGLRYTDDIEPELRYTMWEQRTKTPSSDPYVTTIMRCVLVYEDMLLQDVMRHARYEYHVNNTRVLPTVIEIETDGGFRVEVATTIASSSRFELLYLGDFEDTACYAILYHGATGLGRFYINRMINYGKSTVVYAPNTVRKLFGRTNIVNATHAGDPVTEAALFEFIDAKVQGHFIGRHAGEIGN